MSGADCLSPLRFFVWVLCVRLCIVRVSVGLVGLVSLVFHYWVENRRCLCSFDARFLITADREMVPISFGASPFHQIGWAEEYCKKAFVRLRLLMIWFSITLSAKEPTQPRLAQILRKILAKTPRSRRHEQSIPPIMKNERPKTQRNFLKRERSRPEHKQLHQIPNWGRATRTGFQLTILSQTRGSNNAPPQRIPTGLEGLESRG